MDPPRRHLQSTSSSSAVDLTGTPAGLAASLPPSPSFPGDGPESVARRRPSWSTPVDQFPHPTVQINTRTFSVDDDPFASPAVSPDDDTPPRSRAGSAYLTTRAGPSSASLIQTHPEDDDDEAYLTTSISHQHPPGWSIHNTEDPERSISASPRSRRKSNRYSTSPSPLKKTGTTLQSVSRSLRHMSVRVVNLAGRGLDDHVRLDDVDDEIFLGQKGNGDPEEPEYPALPDLRKSLPIRGCALGFMGPTNPIRLFLYRFLLFPYVVFYQRRGYNRLLTSCAQMDRTSRSSFDHIPSCHFIYSIRSFPHPCKSQRRTSPSERLLPPMGGLCSLRSLRFFHVRESAQLHTTTLTFTSAVSNASHGYASPV